MVWSSPRTWVANVTALTAAALNTDLRDNLNYLKGLLDGTGSDSVIVPAALSFNNDTNNRITKNGANPIWFVDSGDSLQYDRATNAWWFAVASAIKMTIDANGKLGGSGFYDSGATAIGTATTIALAHGLGARPRFIFGYYTTSGTAALDPASTTNVTPMEQAGGGTNVGWIVSADNAEIVVGNTAASGTTHLRVYAML